MTLETTHFDDFNIYKTQLKKTLTMNPRGPFVLYHCEFDGKMEYIILCGKNLDKLKKFAKESKKFARLQYDLGTYDGGTGDFMPELFKLTDKMLRDLGLSNFKVKQKFDDEDALPGKNKTFGEAKQLVRQGEAALSGLSHPALKSRLETVIQKINVELSNNTASEAMLSSLAELQEMLSQDIPMVVKVNDLLVGMKPVLTEKSKETKKKWDKAKELFDEGHIMKAAAMVKTGMEDLPSVRNFDNAVQIKKGGVDKLKKRIELRAFETNSMSEMYEVSKKEMVSAIALKAKDKDSIQMADAKKLAAELNTLFKGDLRKKLEAVDRAADDVALRNPLIEKALLTVREYIEFLEKRSKYAHLAGLFLATLRHIHTELSNRRVGRDIQQKN